MSAKVDSGPVKVEMRDGVSIDKANRAIRALEPAHDGHGVDYVEQATSDHLTCLCYCGARLQFSGMQLAAVAGRRVR